MLKQVIDCRFQKTVTAEEKAAVNEIEENLLKRKAQLNEIEQTLPKRSSLYLKVGLKNLGSR